MSIIRQTVDCTRKCPYPPGKMLVPMPMTVWSHSDVIRCPHCGDFFRIEDYVPPIERAPI